MIFPTTTAPTQPPVHTFLLQHPPNSTYLSQPFFYPMPFPNPKPNPPPVPPPPQQTIISQSSSSSVSAPTTTVKTENRTEENNNATIIVQPNSAYNRNKNVTIQLKMLGEVCFFYFRKKLIGEAFIFLLFSSINFFEHSINLGSSTCPTSSPRDA
jgi:hypothetical protein